MDVKEVLEKFSNRKIVVVGDIILDSYVYGKVDRISPEAPVPILQIEKGKEFYELGGAANTAANAASLGGEVFLFGYVGEDLEKDILLEKLREKKISQRLIPILEHTILKTRIIGEGQQIVRVDKETLAEPSQESEEKIIREIELINPDIIVASDYAKGALSKSLFFMLKQYANSNEKKIIVDPRPQNKLNYEGVYLITPNMNESMEMSGKDEVEAIGKSLQNELKANILLTRGKEGMVLFEQDKIINIPTAAKEVFDVTGAGDTVAATMALGVSSGLGLEDSAFLANHAAGIVVGKKGTATVSRDELLEIVSSEHKKIKLPEKLAGCLLEEKRQGKKIVLTNGCFDILHPGHVKYLQECREQGDVLVVGINNDNSVRRLKGIGRPINNEMQRAEVLAGLGCVDYVFIFSEENVVKYLELFKPDIHVHGGDRNLETMNQQEKQFAQQYNIRIYFSKKYDSLSTTQIIDRVKNNFDNQGDNGSINNRR